MIQKKDDQFIKDAIFISYTSLSDFLKCPRSYYLKNLYRDPRTGNRVQIASPYLSLGSTVHDAVKWFLDMGGQLTEEQLEVKFRNLWLKYHGKRGGFSSREDEASFGKRGLSILENFYKNWTVLGKPAPNIHFPKLNLLDNLVLMGNFDYVEELPDGTLHVIDFKTGSKDEKDTLQLDIYAILAEANFSKIVSKASFWYLDRDDNPKDIVLDSLEPKLEELRENAKELKKAIEKSDWVCKKAPEACKDCREYQEILDGKLEFQFTDEKYHKDIYFLPKNT